MKKELIKLKKKLIYDIILSRLEEIAELIIFNNINFNYYNKNSRIIFLEIESTFKVSGIKEIIEKVFKHNGTFELRFINNLSIDKTMSTINQLVHFGWKKEAIPVTKAKKSIISRIFDSLFS